MGTLTPSEAEDFQTIGAVVRRMADSPDISAGYRRALREARDLADVAEAAVDAVAQQIVEGREGRSL